MSEHKAWTLCEPQNPKHSQTLANMNKRFFFTNYTLQPNSDLLFP